MRSRNSVHDAGPNTNCLEILAHAVDRVGVHLRDVRLHVAHHRLVDARALVRCAAVRQFDDGVDGEERNLGVVGCPSNLIVRDDALGRQDHAIGGHRQVDVHEGQAVDLRVAELIAALHVDQRDIGIQRRARAAASRACTGRSSRPLQAAGEATSEPSIERIGMNGSPMAPARKRMPIAMWLHSS